eukprot:GHVN01041227.1.p1 GENE.GHVN01041227.1~~GHVN01041227.1.p1  ORF type:complete len:538 (+),score=156.18 GHVN01041227.1:640-2253(+)
MNKCETIHPITLANRMTEVNNCLRDFPRKGGLPIPVSARHHQGLSGFREPFDRIALQWNDVKRTYLHHGKIKYKPGHKPYETSRLVDLSSKPSNRSKGSYHTFTPIDPLNTDVTTDETVRSSRKERFLKSQIVPISSLLSSQNIPSHLKDHSVPNHLTSLTTYPASALTEVSQDDPLTSDISLPPLAMNLKRLRSYQATYDLTRLRRRANQFRGRGWRQNCHSPHLRLITHLSRRRIASSDLTLETSGTKLFDNNITKVIDEDSRMMQEAEIVKNRGRERERLRKWLRGSGKEAFSSPHSRQSAQTDQPPSSPLSAESLHSQANSPPHSPNLNIVTFNALSAHDVSRVQHKLPRPTPLASLTSDDSPKSPTTITPCTPKPSQNGITLKSLREMAEKGLPINVTRRQAVSIQRKARSSSKALRRERRGATAGGERGVRLKDASDGRGDAYVGFAPRSTGPVSELIIEMLVKRKYEKEKRTREEREMWFKVNGKVKKWDDRNSEEEDEDEREIGEEMDEGDVRGYKGSGDIGTTPHMFR